MWRQGMYVHTVHGSPRRNNLLVRMVSYRYRCMASDLADLATELGGRTYVGGLTGLSRRLLRSGGMDNLLLALGTGHWNRRSCSEYI